MSARATGGWVTRVPSRKKVDARIRALTGAQQMVLQVIEGCCRHRCWCRPSSAELEDATGLSRSVLTGHLRGLVEGEDPPLVRVMGPGNRRLGLILRVRFDAERPVSATDDQVEAATREILEASRHRPGQAKSALETGLKSALETGLKSALETGRSPIALKESLSKDEGSKDGRQAGQDRIEASQRQRPGEPPPAPSPRPRVEHPPPAPPDAPRPEVSRVPPVLTPPQPPPPPPPADVPATPAAEPLNDHQRAWLASIPPDWRRAFDQLGDRKRRQILDGYRHGPNPIADVEVRKCLSAGPGPPPLPAAGQASALELLELLPVHGAALVPRCTDAVMHALNDHAGSWRHVETLCREVTAGIRPVESLAVPLQKTLERAEKGQQFHSSPAAYWTTSVENYGRERLGAQGTGRRVTA